MKWQILLVFVEYSFLFPLVQKKFKNRPRKARVIIKNKVARFCGSRCIRFSYAADRQTDRQTAGLEMLPMPTDKVRVGVGNEK